MANNFNDLFNTPDTSYEYDTQDIQSNKVWAFCSSCRWLPARIPGSVNSTPIRDLPSS